MTKTRTTLANQALALAVTAGLFIQLAPVAVATPAEEIEKKLKQIVLPELDFTEATLIESVGYLREKSVELDPDRKGINFVILRSKLEPSFSVKEEIAALTKAVELSNHQMLNSAKDAGIIPGDDVAIPEAYRLARIRFAKDRASMERKRNLVKTRMDIDSEELLKLLVSENKTSLIGELYREYLDSSRKLIAKKKTTPENKSQNAEATAEIDQLKKQLVESVTHYKQSLGTELKMEEENLASAKRTMSALGEEVIDLQRRSLKYQYAKRDYERKLARLIALETAAADPDQKPATAILQFTDVPLEIALKYIAQQIGVSYKVQDHAVVIGSAEEIANLK